VQRLPCGVRVIAGAALLFLSIVITPAQAAEGDNGNTAGSQPSSPPKPSTLLGDSSDVRPTLAKYGLTPAVIETDEVLGNLTGGVHAGFIYEGLTDLSLAYDFRPQFDWRGNFFIRAYQIHGKGLSASNLDNLNTASGIEATATTRLFELWYEQHIDDWLRIRIGQQSAGQEFLITTGAEPFVNSTFGWPTLPSADLPSTGPNYPLATPAVRVRVDASDELTFFGGVFDGNPAGPGPGDPQKRDPAGASFRLDDGILAIFETRYNPGNSSKNGTYRIGAWYNTERFADLEVDTTGLPLAGPASTNMPRLHTGNTSLYGIVDQPLFGGDANSGYAVFSRAMGAPGDRNLVDLYLDAGVTYKNPSENLFGKTGDTLGLAVAYARIGGAARAFAADMGAFTGQPYPRRSAETAIELTYQIQLVDGWQIQPDLQYIINPGGGLPDPLTPATRIKNTLITGVRTTINF
jgi:porin